MLSIKFSLLLGILHLTAGMTEDYKKTSERLWKVIETNALAPTVSKSVHPVCYRSNVSMNQQLVAKQLKQLLEVDASLNDYLTNGQACTGGKNSYFLSYVVSTFKYLMESGRLLLLSLLLILLARKSVEILCLHLLRLTVEHDRTGFSVPLGHSERFNFRM